MKHKLILLLTMFLLVGCSSAVPADKSHVLNAQYEKLVEDMASLQVDLLTIEKENKTLRLELNTLIGEQASYEAGIQYNTSGLEDQKMSVRWLSKNQLLFTNLVSQLDGYYESYGYISEIDVDDKQVIIDLSTFVTVDDLDLINELGLDLNSDFPNGFCIHNPTEAFTSLDINNETTYIRIMYDNDLVEGVVDVNEFIDSLSYKEKYYKLSVYKGTVLQISEFYIP